MSKQSDLSDMLSCVTRLSATEVARHFSEVLNRVLAGEEIEVTRAGAPVALITPPRARLLSAEQFTYLIASAPPVDDAFAGDLRAVRASLAAPEDRWPS